jgi:hypothetical protein
MFLKKIEQRTDTRVQPKIFFTLSLIFVLGCQVFISCSSSTLKGYITGLREVHEERLAQPVVFNIFKKGKQSIPHLIEMMDKHKEWGETLRHPDNQNGLVEYSESPFIYAYLVELILARKSLKRGSVRDSFLGASENYIYWDGVIVACGSKDPVPVDEDEAENIYEIYYQWWRKNQHKSLRRLRAEWKKEIRPLSGTNYCWR